MATTILRPADLYRWAEQAAPGERLVYFTGFLARCRGMARLAEAALWLQVEGAVSLYQRRVGPECFDYIAQRLETAELSGVARSAALLRPAGERGSRRYPIAFDR